MKLTGWYEPDQKPVRKGFYECQCCKKKFYWNGKFWSFNKVTTLDIGINLGWRGIKHE